MLGQVKYTEHGDLGLFHQPTRPRTQPRRCLRLRSCISLMLVASAVLAAQAEARSSAATQSVTSIHALSISAAADENPSWMTPLWASLDFIGLEELRYLPTSSIVEGDRGFLWIATTVGLFRFDGNRFAPLSELLQASDETDLPLPIWHLRLDGSGMLWIATASGLWRYSTTTGELFSYANTELGKDVDVLCTAAGTSSSLWVATKTDGLFLIAMDGAVLSHLQPGDGTDGQLASTSVESILRVGADLWIGQFDLQGLRILNTKTGTLHNAPGGPYGGVRTLRFDQEEFVLLTRSSRATVGLYRIHPGTFAKQVWRFPSGGWSYAVAQVGPHQLLAGGLGFLPQRIDIRTGEQAAARFPDPLDQSLIHAIDTLFLDSRGLLWVGSFQGLRVFERRQPELPVRPLRSNFARTAHGGHHCYFSNGSSMRAIHAEGVELSSGDTWVRSRAAITPLSVACGADRLWILGEDSSSSSHKLVLQELSPRDEEIGRTPTKATINNGYANPVLLVLGTNRLLIGIPSGLQLLSRSEETAPWSTSEIGSVEELVYSIAVGLQGTVWLTTDTGLVHLDQELHLIKRYREARTAYGNQPVNQPSRVFIGNESQEPWWIDTQGIYKFLRGSDEFEMVLDAKATVPKALSPFDITLIEDRQRTLWTSAFGRIYSIDAETSCVQMHRSPTGQTHFRAQQRPEGPPAFLGALGIEIPTQRRSTTGTRIAVTGLRGNGLGQRLRQRVNLGLLATDSRERRTLHLNPGHFPITLSIALIDATPDSEFQARLHANSNWESLPGGELVLYSLPWGRSEVSLRGASPGNAQWADPLNLVILVRRPFWATWWFRALILLGLLTGTAVAIRWRLRQAQRRQEALQARNDELLRIQRFVSETLDSLSEIVIRLNERGQITGLNRAALTFIGKPRESIIGTTLNQHATLTLEGRDLQPNLESLQRVPPGTLLSLKEGGSRLVGGSLTQIEDLSGVTGRVLVLRDISREEHLQAQLNKRQRLETVGTLASGFAHDFNNLLFTMSLTLDSLDTSRASEPAVLLRKQVDSAAGLLQQFRWLWQPSTQSRETFELDAVVTEVTTSVAAQLDESKVELHLDLAGPFPLSGDRSLFVSLVYNLVINALQAMKTPPTAELPRNTLTLTTSPAGEEEIPAVLLSIRDTGSGMTAEQAEHCFDPFYSTKPAESSSGLGLFMVHQTLTAMGGEIWCQQHSVGCEFIAKVPLCEPTEHSSSDARRRTAPLRGTVLVAEEDSNLLAGLCALLEKFGLVPTQAWGGVEALRRVKKRAYDIYLIDLRMPLVGGEEIIQAIQQWHPRGRIIVMSGWFDVATSERLRQAGVTEMVQKPISSRSLHKLLASGPSIESDGPTPTSDLTN